MVGFLSLMNSLIGRVGVGRFLSAGTAAVIGCILRLIGGMRKRGLRMIFVVKGILFKLVHLENLRIFSFIIFCTYEKNMSMNKTEFEFSCFMLIFQETENKGLFCNSPFLLLMAEGLAVRALVHSGILLMGTHKNPVQRAVVFIFTMISTLGYGAFNALVCVAVHDFFPPFLLAHV
jgi:hypothetical protein